jgi:hypothetical protein
VIAFVRWAEAFRPTAMMILREVRRVASRAGAALRRLQFDETHPTVRVLAYAVQLRRAGQRCTGTDNADAPHSNTVDLGAECHSVLQQLRHHLDELPKRMLGPVASGPNSWGASAQPNLL